MIEYKYKKRENKFTENGHTMFETDVLQRLKRLADLEDQIKQKKILPIQRVIESVCPECDNPYPHRCIDSSYICEECGHKWQNVL